MCTEDVDESLPAESTSAGRVVVPESSEVPPSLSALAASAVALQQLTVALVHRTGTNPDLIRREEEPYRDAAGIAEAKFGTA